MKRIWKYDLPIQDESTIYLPQGAEVLSVQEPPSALPGEALVLWAEVDDEAPIVQRLFKIYGTGHPIKNREPGDWYLATVQTAKGLLVWHVFETEGD